MSGVVQVRLQPLSGAEGIRTLIDAACKAGASQSSHGPVSRTGTLFFPARRGTRLSKKHLAMGWAHVPLQLHEQWSLVLAYTPRGSNPDRRFKRPELFHLS